MTVAVVGLAVSWWRIRAPLHADGPGEHALAGPRAEAEPSPEAGPAAEVRAALVSEPQASARADEPRTTVLARVRTSSAAPIPAARVEIARLDERARWLGEPPFDELVIAGRGETDDQGQCGIELDGSPQLLRARVTADGYCPGLWTFESHEELDCRLARAFALSGRVLDRDTLAPIRGAVVGFADQGPMRSISDAEGRYELAPLPAGGVLRLSIAADDYAEATRTFEAPDDPAEIEYDVQLARGVLVRGEVRDWTTDVPLEGVTLHESHVCGKPVRTDLAGRFEIRVLESRGRLPLRLAHDEFCSLALSFPIEEPPNEPVRLRLPRGVRIEGSVRASSGEAISGADVWVHPQWWRSEEHGILPELPAGQSFQDGEGRSFVTDAAGGFRGCVPLVPWTFAASVGARSPEHRPHSEELAAELEPGEVVRVDLVLAALDDAPTGSIAGTLTVNGTPRAGGLSWRGQSRSGGGEADESGAFVLADVEVGEVALTLGNPRSLGLPWLGRDGLSRTVDVVAGTTTELDLAFEIELGTIRGHVHYASGEPAVGLGLWARGTRRFGGSSAEVGEDGSYELAVAADDGPFDVQLEDRPSARRGDVPAGTDGVDFVVAELGRLRVRVFDEDSRSPPSRFEVGWRLPGESSYRYLGTSYNGVHPDPDGWYDLDVPGALVDLWVSGNHDGYLPVFEPGVPVGRIEDPTTTEIRLQRGFSAVFRAPSPELPDSWPDDRWIVLVEETLADEVRVGPEEGAPWTVNGRGVWGGERFPAGTLRHRRLVFRDGEARVRGLAAGRYVLLAFPPSPSIEPSRFAFDGPPDEPIDLTW